MNKRNEHIVCADGFTMSVQASEFTYCTPRVADAAAYTEVEVGYPNTPEPLLLEWAEEPDNPTDTVYGYVPSDVIVTVCAKHGGVVSGELPAGIPKIIATR